MSALPQPTDIADHEHEVRKVPIADSCTAAKNNLFDYLVGKIWSSGGILSPIASAVLRLITRSNP
jgi:hypothetical protein